MLWCKPPRLSAGPATEAGGQQRSEEYRPVHASWQAKALVLTVWPFTPTDVATYSS